MLKGLGCKTSIAIVTTIKPGNNFGEQVMQKVFADMTGLDGLTEDGIALGNQDFTSNWGVWRNRANPKGSDNLSFQAVDAIYCTNWDDFSVFAPGQSLETNLRQLTDSGYRGKKFIPEDVSSQHAIRSLKITQIKREDNIWSQELNRPLYNGCFAPTRPN
jgi:hypothetical protein